MKAKIGIFSLGCPRNLVDAENFLGRLKSKGYSISDIEQAQIGIVNTCCFIEDSKRESVEAIMSLIDLKNQGKLKKVIVCGCLAQRYRDELVKKLPEVDCWIGSPSLNHSKTRFGITPKHYAYLKICESCLNCCSYCIIPKLKGKFSSLDMESALDKVSVFDKEGVSELNIIGQDISGYGLDLYGKKMLPEMVKKIAKAAKNIGWIRLLYLYPDDIIDPLLDVMKDEPRICRYIDLPVQHINDRILKLMGRRGGKKQIISLIHKIRAKLPGAAIRTSVIVGFPSETEKEFKELLDFIKEVKFERLGAFIYSREEGTKAYAFRGQVPKPVKSRRFDAIMSCQQEISRENNKKLMGKTLKVLIGEAKKDYYVGRSEYDAPEVDGEVYVYSKKNLKPGDFVNVKIKDTLEYDLVGDA